MNSNLLLSQKVSDSHLDFAQVDQAIAIINRLFTDGVDVLRSILFFGIGGIPLVMIWLLGGAIFFTLRMGFVNVRAFGHAIAVALGRYEEADAVGEMSHFQALSTSLSATIGLGNIAGVAIALQLGGPGAVFWMTLTGFLGMSTKFVECTLGQKYRVINPDGSISGGPMYYISRGLGSIGWPKFGQTLAVLFAVLCLGAGFGIGNMFQANQSYAALATVFPFLVGRSWLYGLLIAGLVGLVILGGIQRIAQVAAAIVPAMGFLYVAACGWILLLHLPDIPSACGAILGSAFSPSAAEGGLVGVLVQGVQRGVFSNGAGVGGAAIAHAATRTKEPVREGILSTLEPFIDTVIICNATALVCIVTGVYGNAELQGIAITAAAFASVGTWFPLLLSVVVCLFAFSTIISSFYYGERCWIYLAGSRGILGYKLVFTGFTFVGTVVNLMPVVAFSDIMVLTMAVPNILCGLLLSGQIARDLDDYLWRLKRGVMDSPSRTQLSGQQAVNLPQPQEVI